ncbi:MAG: hypothetical protein FGM24_02695 [Candidatus Kapabacteria bacterium]|nr:hypothetical protein [Candidatus Kapabacteria bacterium]
MNRFFPLMAMLAMVFTLSVATAVAAPSPRPTGFIPNHGQWPAEVLFAARTPTLDVFVTPAGMTFTRVRTADVPDAPTTTLRAEWQNTTGATGTVYHPTDQVVAFYRGKSAHVVHVSDRVTVTNVYPGVDVVYTLQDEQLRFDLDVRPGAELARVALRWPYVARFMTMADAHGEIRQVMIDNCLRLDRLHVEQEGTPLNASFAMEPVDDGIALSFNIEGYDPAKRLLIDPVVYGAYIGSKGNDLIAGLEYTARQEVIIAGAAEEIQFPDAGSTVNHGSTGQTDAFIARMDPKLTKVISFAFIGGSDHDRARGMCVDKANSVYIVGETQSANFPTSSGASGQIYKAGLDGFLVKLDSNLTALKLATYHGGNKDDSPRGVAVDKNLTIYVAGTTLSNANFPVTFPVSVTVSDWRGRQSTTPGGGANLGGIEGFVASFSQSGTMLQGRFFGRSGDEIITAIAVDNASGVYITGSTSSSDFETAPTPSFFASGRLPYDRTFGGGITDAFITKFNNELALAKSDDGTYSSYLGGSGDEQGRGVFVDDLGRAHVVGVTNSPNLEAVSTLNTTPIGGQDIFMAVMSDDGRDLKSLTYYGGSGNDEVLGAKPYTTSTTAVIYGYTVSVDFPTTGTGSESNRAGTTDGFVALINTTTNRYCTLLGASADDTVRAAIVDPKGDIVYAMSTTSTNLPTHEQSYNTKASGQDIFLGKFAFGSLELASPRGGESYCVGANIPVTWQVLDMLADDKYSLELSTDNGTTWTEIAKGLTTKAYTWKPTDLQPGSTYRMAIRSERGHLSSTPAPFTLNLPPKIDRQPVAASACVGQPVTLSIEASGTSVKYQWRHNGSNINGATKSTLELTVSASSLGKYDCVVTGSCNPQLNSTVVDVTEATPTAISKQPQDVTVDEGAAFELGVTATGGTLTYQWSKDGTNIDGATAATYKVAAAAMADAATYRCVVTGGCGVVTSEAATVKVNKAVNSAEELSDLGARILGPQPADEVVRLAVDQPQESMVVRIIDLSGRVVSMVRPGSTQVISIPVQSLAPATYILEFTSAGRVAQGTFVIQR